MKVQHVAELFRQIQPLVTAMSDAKFVIIFIYVDFLCLSFLGAICNHKHFF